MVLPLTIKFVETDLPSDLLEMAVLGFRSLVLVIMNNRVLRKIKIVVESDVKTIGVFTL